VGQGFRRVGAAFGVGALLVVLAAAPANAATTGVGSSSGGETLVGVDYGDVIAAAVLNEFNDDTIDPAVGVPTASETLAPLDVHSVTQPALDALSAPRTQVQSTGAEQSANPAPPAINLQSLGIPGFEGAINPASLSALVDANGAKSALTSTMARLNALGVVSIDSSNVNLGGLAGPTSATSDRSVTADAITVLDLQALLNLLGLDVSELSNLTLATLLDDLGQLGALNDLLGTSFVDPTDVTDEIATLNSAINSAQSTLDTVTAVLAAAQNTLNVAASAEAACHPACAQPIIDALTAAQNAFATAQTAVNEAQAAVDTLQGDLDDLIQALLNLSASAPLIEIDGLTAGATALAADTVGNSKAIVTARINDLRIAGVSLGSIDATTTIDEIKALASTATDTLNGILGSDLSDLLDNLLSIKLFDQSTNVGTAGDYVTSEANVVALALTITPPNICDLVGALLTDGILTEGVVPDGVDAPAAPVRSLLAQLGSINPLCVPLDELQSQAIAGFPALTDPIAFTVASVNSTAEFKVAPAAATVTPTQEPLPRTGLNTMLLLLFGGLMVVAALGVRRVTAAARETTDRR